VVGSGGGGVGGLLNAPDSAGDTALHVLLRNEPELKESSGADWTMIDLLLCSGAHDDVSNDHRQIADTGSVLPSTTSVVGASSAPVIRRHGVKYQRSC